MTAKAFVKYLLFFVIALLIIAFAYLKISFEQPAVSAIEDVQLNTFSDTGSAIILTVRIKNPNAFSIKVKDLKVTLNELVNGSAAELPITLPAHSEEIYQVPISIRYDKIETLFQLVDSSKKNMATVELKAKPSFWFSYIDVREKVDNNANGEFIPQLMATIIKKNLTITKIHWPKEINTTQADVAFDVEISNPYDVELLMNHYDIKIFDDSTQSAILGKMSNDSSIAISAHSKKIFSNKISIKPMQSAMSAALRMLQGGLTYYVLLEGSVGINNYRTKFSTGFLINPFNLSQ